MAFAAASDLLNMTISNRISLALVAGFAVLAVVCGLTPRRRSRRMRPPGCWCSRRLALFARGLVGGGDAKLAAGAALWFGFGRLADYALLGALLGGVLTLAILAFQFMPLPTWLAGQSWAVRLHQFDGDVPYGVALAAAALLIYPSTTWMPP